MCGNFAFAMDGEGEDAVTNERLWLLPASILISEHSNCSFFLLTKKNCWEYV